MRDEQVGSAASGTRWSRGEAAAAPLNARPHGGVRAASQEHLAGPASDGLADSLAPLHLVVEPVDGRLLVVSRAAQAWYGRSASQTDGTVPWWPRNLADLDRDGERGATACLAVLRGDGPVSLTLRHRSHDGSPRDAVATARPVPGVAGGVWALVLEPATPRPLAGSEPGSASGSPSVPRSEPAPPSVPRSEPAPPSAPGLASGPLPDPTSAAPLAAAPSESGIGEVAQAVLERAPIGIAIADPAGRLVAVNPAMSTITGFPRDELLGRDYRHLTHPDDRVQTDQERGRLWDGDTELYRMEKRYRRRDGSTALVEVASVLLRDADGRPHRQLGFVLDVTAQRQLAEATAQLVATIEHANEGIVTLDADLRLTFANQRAATLLGRTVPELLGGLLAETVPELGEAPLAARLHRARVGDPLSAEVIAVGAGDRWLELSASPSPLGLVLFLHDVTERVAHEAEQQRALQAERATVSMLEDVDRARSAFLSAVSHELRTPLSVILGMSETLVSRHAVLPDDRRVQVQQALHHQSQRLAALLEDLLHIDQLSRRAVALRRRVFALPPVIAAAVASSRDPARVDVRCPSHLEVELDRIQVERIVVNLLSNVDKYAPDGPVELRVEPLGRCGVRLRVRDHGPGLALADRQRVFGAYVRADEQHPEPGTGVGLALVAEFAALHGGRAWAAAPDGPGACVIVELPGPDDPETGRTATAR